MTATLQIKKERSNYYVLIRYQDNMTGKERQKWITTDIPVKGNNKREANARLKEILSDFEGQNVDLSKDVLFTVFIREWLENLKSAIEAVTYDTYRLIIHNQIIPYYEPKKLKIKDITPLHIQQYVTFKLKTVSPNTVTKHLWNLSKCFDSAVKQKIIAFNPVKMIDKPKRIKYTGAKYYNEQQIDELLDISKGDIIKGIILLAVFYGLRRSEILGLKWGAVDTGHGTITIQHTIVRIDKMLHKKDSTKNKSSYRVLPMPKIIRNMLYALKITQEQNKLLQPNDYINEGYIFTHVDGRLISPNYVTKHFKKLIEKHGLPIIRFHDLRHSTASYLLSLGFSLKDIQAWLGHGDIGTTANLYIHLGMEAKNNIADKLNDKFQRFDS